MTGREAGGDAELKKELDATLHARRELGEEYESALVDSFLEKVEQRLDGAVDRRVRRQLAEQQMVVARGTRSPEGASDSWGERFGFGIVSLVLAVPLSAIGGSVAHLPGLLVAWASTSSRPRASPRTSSAAAGARTPTGTSNPSSKRRRPRPSIEEPRRRPARSARAAPV
jgi:hypothetical protein